MDIYPQLHEYEQKQSDFLLSNLSTEEIAQLKELMAKYDYNTLGGANLLGVTKPVIKGHGAGEAETFYNMIKEAYALAKGNMIGIMESLLA